MHYWLRTTMVATALALTACPRAPTPPEAEAPPAGVTPPPTAAREYRIDSRASVIAIEVYRGGPLKRLGHNHLITAGDLAGSVWLVEGDLNRSAFDLRFAVASLVVDDPQARRAAGEAFPPDVPEADKEATRANMLGPEVLESQRYPEVRVRALSVSADGAQTRVKAAVTIRDVTRVIDTPVELEIAEQSVRARGHVTVRQSAFGIEPFAVALGAVRVEDEITIRFDLVAHVPQRSRRISSSSSSALYTLSSASSMIAGCTATVRLSSMS